MTFDIEWHHCRCCASSLLTLFSSFNIFLLCICHKNCAATLTADVSGKDWQICLNSQVHRHGVPLVNNANWINIWQQNECGDRIPQKTSLQINKITSKWSQVDMEMRGDALRQEEQSVNTRIGDIKNQRRTKPIPKSMQPTAVYWSDALDARLIKQRGTSSRESDFGGSRPQLQSAILTHIQTIKDTSSMAQCSSMLFCCECYEAITMSVLHLECSVHCKPISMYCIKFTLLCAISSVFISTHLLCAQLYIYIL